MAFRRSSIVALLAIAVFAAAPAWAQQMKAMPAAAVEAAETLAPPPGLGSIVFLELFSAENCPFCPLAEQHFNDVASDRNTVIGYSCMVNYFDSGQSQTSQSFCGVQQDFYIERLISGSRYTPQLIINGEAQMPGHDLQKLAAGIQAARQKSTQPRKLDIQPGANGTFKVQLPLIEKGAQDRRYALRLVMIKSRADLSELTHKRHKRNLMPNNIAVAMIDGGLWNGTKTTWPVQPPVDTEGDSFIAMVQDRDTGRVIAAGMQDLRPSAVKN